MLRPGELRQFQRLYLIMCASYTVSKCSSWPFDSLGPLPRSLCQAQQRSPSSRANKNKPNNVVMKENKQRRLQTTVRYPVATIPTDLVTLNNVQLSISSYKNIEEKTLLQLAYLLLKSEGGVADSLKRFRELCK